MRTIKSVDAAKAKAHFSALLDEIERGSEIMITRHGRPVAKLMPVVDRQQMTPREAIDGLRKLRSRLRLNGDWKQFRDAGRR